MIGKKLQFYLWVDRYGVERFGMMLPVADGVFLEEHPDEADDLDIDFGTGKTAKGKVIRVTAAIESEEIATPETVVTFKPYRPARRKS